jgi:hypothetical protein
MQYLKLLFPNVAADMLLLLFPDIWKEEKFPKEWT